RSPAPTVAPAAALEAPLGAPGMAPVEHRVSRPHSPHRNLIPWMVLADVVVIVAAMAIAFAMRTVLPGQDPSGAQSRHLLVAELSLPAWVLILHRYRLYSPRRIASRLDQFGGIVHASLASVLVMAGVAFSLRLYVARGWLLLTFAVSVTALLAERELIRRLRQLVAGGVEVELSSSLQDIAAERLTLWALGRHPVVYVQPRFRRGWRGIGKRAFDLVLSTVGLVLSAPALLLAAIAIKLDS